MEEGILSKAMSKKDLDDKIIQAGMFNDKATDAERNTTLRDLIQKDNVVQPDGEEEQDEDSGDEIFTDLELNYELARSEPELELFIKMDNERYILENKDARIAAIREKIPALMNKS